MRSAWALMDLAARKGLTLRADGNLLRVDGPTAARAELRNALKDHKAEILAILRSQGQPGARPVMPPDEPGRAEWHRDYRGEPVNLWPVRNPGGVQ